MAGNQDWAARASGTTGILFVCHGNICRSTMAQFVMEELVRRAGRAGSFEIDSAATSREELGNDVHPGTRERLRRAGIPCGHHAARQMGPRDYDRFDYIVGMDRDNYDGMYRLLLGERGMGFSWPPVSAQIVHEADAKSTEYISPEDVDHLCARTTPYAEKWAPEAERLWLEEHPTGKKIYADKMSNEKISLKAKLIAEEDAKAEEAVKQD